ncbi:MAG: hypothetical protein BroJett026_10910 [Betaproteobacteria bacterium]|nr:MAG: hypothetical protein BroJett026_10910 [Betaproteobacteria bacterium]
MRPLASIAGLPRHEAVAVIINCGTRWVSSLALLSLLRHGGLPVLVVDCESRDGSRVHFAALAARHGLCFDWLDWPLRTHPETLDRLFAAIDADEVLLVDSDLELLDAGLVPAMRAALAGDAQAYGAGFLHGPGWMGPEHGLPAHTGWYAQRMWIPFVLLRARAVREALHAAQGFGTLRRFDATAWLARLVAAATGSSPPASLARFRVPGFPAAAPGGGERRPAVVEHDTGALLHEHLLAHGWRFAALPQSRWSDVRHFHGVTRAARGSRVRRALARLGVARATGEPRHAPALREALERLREGYGVDRQALDDAIAAPSPSRSRP